MHELSPTAALGEVGISLNIHWGQPGDPQDQEDVAAAERYMQFRIGWFAKPIFIDGLYPSVMRDMVHLVMHLMSRLCPWTQMLLPDRFQKSAAGVRDFQVAGVHSGGDGGDPGDFGLPRYQLLHRRPGRSRHVWHQRRQLLCRQWHYNVSGWDLVSVSVMGIWIPRLTRADV